MSAKAKKFLCEKLPITLVAGLLCVVLFKEFVSPGFIELIRMGNAVCVS